MHSSTTAHTQIGLTMYSIHAKRSNKIGTTTKTREIRLQCSMIDDVNDLSEFYLREPIYEQEKGTCKYVNPFVLFCEWIFFTFKEFKVVKGFHV